MNQTLLQIAQRNIRQYVAKASFSSQVDRIAANNCLDVMDEALTALGELDRAEAEPVAYQYAHPYFGGGKIWRKEQRWNGHTSDEARALYTTPLPAKPAPLGPALGMETQRHRDNEIDALEQKLARADARITELERECSQWRDELRIYRETESKRIAELERSVTVRDTEIARLETDSELARRDAERYRWLRDSDNEGPISAGNATAFGEYGFERVEWFYDDELDAAVDEARAGNGPGRTGQR